MLPAKKSDHVSKMLRVVSANLNGIRSANVKGFLNWLNKQDADVVCVQELKAQIDDLSPEMRKPGIYRILSLCGEEGLQRGGNLHPPAPDRVIEGLGNEEFDAEGRYLQPILAPCRSFPLLALRLQLGGAPGCKVPLHGSVPAPHGGAARQDAR
jgi:hypothetical protein